MCSGEPLNADEQMHCSHLLQGHMSLQRLREGLYLHCSDVLHLQDLHSQFMLSKPGLKLLLKLEGDGQLRIGNQWLPLQAAHGQRPRGGLLYLQEPAGLLHFCPAGVREHMLMLSFTPAWLGDAGLQELAWSTLWQPWTPSPRAVTLARQLLRPVPPAMPAAQRLRQEALVLELLAEALQACMPAPAQALPAPLRPQALQRIHRLRAWLDSGQANHCSLAELARHMACPAHTLQRDFRAVFGQPIFGYLRGARLQQAANALQQQDLSVTQAAALAGFSSPANFATAFRKRFGYSPRALRQHGTAQDGE